MEHVCLHMLGMHGMHGTPCKALLRRTELCGQVIVRGLLAGPAGGDQLREVQEAAGDVAAQTSPDLQWVVTESYTPHAVLATLKDCILSSESDAQMGTVLLHARVLLTGTMPGLLRISG